jgi:hypothetical protein
MDDRADALHATRVGVASVEQSRARSLAAPQTVTHADRHLYALSFWRATYFLMVAREFVMHFSVWSPRLYFPL